MPPRGSGRGARQPKAKAKAGSAQRAKMTQKDRESWHCLFGAAAGQQTEAAVESSNSAAEPTPSADDEGAASRLGQQSEAAVESSNSAAEPTPSADDEGAAERLAKRKSVGLSAPETPSPHKRGKW